MSDSNNSNITYGSVISISHIEDEDALLTCDGFIKNSVGLRGMSPHMRWNSPKFSIEQLDHYFMGSCLFIVCPKMSNGAKREVLSVLYDDDEDVGGVLMGKAESDA